MHARQIMLQHTEEHKEGMGCRGLGVQTDAKDEGQAVCVPCRLWRREDELQLIRKPTRDGLVRAEEGRLNLGRWQEAVLVQQVRGHCTLARARPSTHQGRALARHE